MKIFIIGMTGTGKTTVGAFVAQKIGYEFVDTDDLVVKKHGEIKNIFQKYGEDVFREYESSVLSSIIGEDSNLLTDNKLTDNIIIATGGGIILSSKNRRLIKKSGMIINLSASVETIFNHIKNDNSRPLLASCDEFKKLNLLKIYDERKQIYKDICDYEISVDNLSIKDIADKILFILKSKVM